MRSGVALLALALACASGPAPGPEAGDAEAPYSLGRHFRARQLLLARHPGGRHRLELALEAGCHGLRLVGLSPVGSRLFSAIHDGSGLQVQAPPGLPLPVPPEEVLRDIELVFFASHPMESGSRELRRGPLRVREHWEEGRLRLREWLADEEASMGEHAGAGASGPGERGVLAEIRYLEYVPHSAVPRRVTLSNRLRGYEIDLRNADVEEWTCPLPDP